MEMRFVLAADSAKAKQVGDVALSAETVIGRAPKGTHTHVLPGDWVQISSTHCRIYKAPDKYFLEDLSTNGTAINGERVERNEPRALKEGDRVRLAPANSSPDRLLEYVFRAVPASAEPPAAAAHQPERRPAAAANGANGAGSGDPASSPTARASGNKRPRAAAEEGGDDVLVVLRSTNEVLRKRLREERAAVAAAAANAATAGAAAAADLAAAMQRAAEAEARAQERAAAQVEAAEAVAAEARSEAETLQAALRSANERAKGEAARRADAEAARAALDGERRQAEEAAGRLAAEAKVHRDEAAKAQRLAEHAEADAKAAKAAAADAQSGLAQARAAAAALQEQLAAAQRAKDEAADALGAERERAGLLEAYLGRMQTAMAVLGNAERKEADATRALAAARSERAAAAEAMRVAGQDALALSSGGGGGSDAARPSAGPATSKTHAAPPREDAPVAGGHISQPAPALCHPTLAEPTLLCADAAPAALAAVEPSADGPEPAAAGAPGSAARQLATPVWQRPDSAGTAGRAWSGGRRSGGGGSARRLSLGGALGATQAASDAPGPSAGLLPQPTLPYPAQADAGAAAAAADGAGRPALLTPGGPALAEPADAAAATPPTGHAPGASPPGCTALVPTAAGPRVQGEASGERGLGARGSTPMSGHSAGHSAGGEEEEEDEEGDGDMEVDGGVALAGHAGPGRGQEHSGATALERPSPRAAGAASAQQGQAGSPTLSAATGAAGARQAGGGRRSGAGSEPGKENRAGACPNSMAMSSELPAGELKPPPAPAAELEVNDSEVNGSDGCGVAQAALMQDAQPGTLFTEGETAGML